MKNKFGCALICGVVLFGLYVSLSWFIFEWKNPLCNELAFYKHFPSVLVWERLPQYQYEEKKK